MLHKQYQQGNTFLPFLGLITIAILITANIWLYVKSQKEIPVAPTVVEPTVATTDSMADWQTYTDDEYQFSFSYPADWKFVRGVDEDPTDPTAVGLFIATLPDSSAFILINASGLDQGERNDFPDLPSPNETSINVGNTSATLHHWGGNTDLITLNQYPASWADNHFIETRFDDKGLRQKILSTFRFTDEPVIKIPDDWENYTDNKIGFSFAYPKPWKLTTENGDPSVIATIFYQPIDEAYNLNGGISIYVRVHGANGQSLDDWFQQNAEYTGERIQQKVDYMKQEGSGSLRASDMITNFQNITIDSVPAIVQYTKELKPTYIEGGASTRKEYYFKKGDKIISIIGQTSSGSQAQGMINLFDQFIDTFKFIK